MSETSNVLISCIKVDRRPIAVALDFAFGKTIEDLLLFRLDSSEFEEVKDPIEFEVMKGCSSY